MNKVKELYLVNGGSNEGVNHLYLMENGQWYLETLSPNSFRYLQRISYTLAQELISVPLHIITSQDAE